MNPKKKTQTYYYLFKEVWLSLMLVLMLIMCDLYDDVKKVDNFLLNPTKILQAAIWKPLKSSNPFGKIFFSSINLK